MGINDDSAGLTPIQQRIIDASAEIRGMPPNKADFLHSVMCQAGLPRSRVVERTFTRSVGAVSLHVRAGQLWDGQNWKEQPLPYGTKPRLVLVHISSEAVIKRCRDIEVGHSIRGFLNTLGMGATGGRNGTYNSFKAQIMALAACQMSIGFTGAQGGITQVNTMMIEEVELWLHPNSAQPALWPGIVRLSERFYETLLEHAVPLDRRALGALQHSALALDVYTWLAIRLFKVTKRDGVKLSWENLKSQFGQEYVESRDFKREMRKALHSALIVYPSARVEMEPGGIRLRSSPPPVPTTSSQVMLPSG